MAILSGYRVSGLWTNGLAGGLFGMLFRSPMIPLSFTLQVAGAVPYDFEDAPEVDPQLECQERNSNIRLIAVVVDNAEVAIDLSTASSMKIKLLAPDGTTIVKTASLLTSGVDGSMKYDTVPADLIQAGLYKLQAEYTISGKTQSTRWGAFWVRSNID
jgi:hypothetical protein